MRIISLSWRFIMFGTLALATGGRVSFVSAQGLPISTSYGGSRMQSPDGDDVDGTQNTTAAGPRAQSPTHGDDRYRAILARLEAQERELRDLRKRLGQSAGPASLVSQPDPASGYGPAAPPGAPPMPPPPTLDDVAPADQGPSLDERVGKLEKLTAPKTPLIKLGGFSQLDTAFYNQDLASLRTYGQMQDGTGFRRTRLQAYGSVSEHTNYIIEMDFAQAGRPSFFDVWAEQTNLGWLGTVRIGQFRQPFTMDCLTSIRHLEFLERSAAFNSMDPLRRVGIMSYNMSEDRNTMWMGSVYRPSYTFLNPTNNTVTDAVTGIDSRFGNFVGNSGGWATAWRATHLLWYDEPAEGRYLLHVGGGYDYTQIGGNGGPPSAANGDLYIARTIPGVFVGEVQNIGVTSSGTPNVANSGSIPATAFSFYHAELAGQYGSAHFQTEWIATSLQTMTAGNIMMNGAYFQTGYFLTGEHCGYNRQFGVMDYNVRPNTEFFGLGRGKGIAGWGAWEVAGRWDYLNLPNAGFAPPSAAAVASGATNAGTSATNPNPGTLNIGTVALNWWWNQYTRVQFNYMSVWQNSDFAVYGKSHTNIYALRFQVEF